MSNQSEVGLVLGLEAGPLQRELAKVSKALGGMEKLLNPKTTKKLFDDKAVSGYVHSIVELNKELAKTLQMHREIGKLARSLGGGNGGGGNSSGAQGGSGGGGGDSGGAGGGSSSKKSKAWTFLRGGALRLAGRAASWIKGNADAGLQTYTMNQAARSSSARLTGADIHPEAWQSARRRMERHGHRLGYTTAESHGWYQGTAQATGMRSTTDAKQNMGFARAFGFNPGTLFGLQMASRQAGGIHGSTTANHINKAVIEGARVAKFAQVLAPEFAKAMTPVIAKMGGSGPVNIKQTMGLAGVLSRHMGGQYRKSPGRSASLVGSFHDAIAGGGGNDAARALSMRAMGLGKKGVSLFDATLQAEKGATPENIRRVLTILKQDHGGNTKDMAFGLKDWLQAESGKNIPLKEAHRLVQMDPAKLSNARINQAMGKNTDRVAGDLKYGQLKVSQDLWLQKKEIARNETRANMRAKLEPAYDLAFQAEIAAMNKVAQAATGAASLIGELKKSINDWLSGAWLDMR